MGCTLHRRTGSAIACETVEVGPGGMSVCTGRPLATDELVSFDLPPASDTPLTGRARVLRHEGHQVYVLRFERLQDTVRAGLEQLAASLR